MTRELLQARLTKATEDLQALMQRRHDLTAARDRATAEANAAQGRVQELTELLALIPPREST